MKCALYRNFSVKITKNFEVHTPADFFRCVLYLLNSNCYVAS